MAVGAQIGLFQFASGHLSIPGVNDFWNAVMVTARTILHIPSDFVDLYFVQVSGPAIKSLPLLPATVISAFRLTYDAAIALSIWALYRGYHFYKPMAAVASTRVKERSNPGMEWDRFLDCLHEVCLDQGNWGNKFHDEMVFTTICLAFLEGNFDIVKEMSRRFAAIEVDNDVRSLS